MMPQKVCDKIFEFNYPTTSEEVLMQTLQNDYRRAFLEMLQFFGSNTERMRKLEAAVEGLTQDIQIMKTEKDEAASFRLRMEDEIQNLKDQIQNLTALKSAEVVVQVEPSLANGTADMRPSSSFNTTVEPETETRGPDQIWLDDMLKNPYAKLYSAENFTGKTEWYRSKSSNKGQCHITVSLRGRVKSVETLGKCIRLFRESDCLGLSLAVYPGSTVTHSVLNRKLLVGRSVGPCLEDEFQGSTFQDSRKETVRKDPDGKDYVPDLVEFFSFEKYNNGTSLSSSNNPIVRYTLGPKNRVEFLDAGIFPKHLNVSQSVRNMRNSSYFTSLEQEEGDVVGYGIPPSLGGPWDANYNIFPQTLAGSREWTRIASRAKECLETV